MRTLHALIAACALVSCGVVTAFASSPGRPDVPTPLQQVAGFAFVADLSGSMMLPASDLGNEPKIVLAKRLLGLINDRIPELPRQAGLFTMGPAATAVRMGDWNRLIFGNAIAALPAKLPVYGRVTRPGRDITALSPSLNLRNGALILVSDGWRSLDPDGVAAFRSALQASGATLHIISFADSAEGEASLQALAALSPAPCASARDLLFNPSALDAFVRSVFSGTGH
jgi:OOP family OmpA-OmpF porin